jgi:acetyl esterase/lipase
VAGTPRRAGLSIGIDRGAEAHRKLYGHLAKAVGCRALIPHYRRAPEYVHPAPVDDAVAAYRWLLDQGIAPGHIALTGDSAGGALAVTTLLRARERNLPMPAATMPLSPWVDMEITGESLVSNRDKDALVQKEVVEVMAATFLGEAGNRKDPLANPLYADLKGLPPMYIQVGGDETLLDDSRRLADRAREAGVDVRLDVFPEMQHVFHFAAGHAPEADDAIRKLALWRAAKAGPRLNSLSRPPGCLAGAEVALCCFTAGRRGPSRCRALWRGGVGRRRARRPPSARSASRPPAGSEGSRRSDRGS